MFNPDTPLSLLAICEQNRPNPGDDQETEMRKKSAICEATVAFGTYQMDLPLDRERKELVCEARALALDALAALSRGDKSAFHSSYVNLTQAVKSVFWKFDREHLWPLADNLM